VFCLVQGLACCSFEEELVYGCRVALVLELELVGLELEQAQV